MAQSGHSFPHTNTSASVPGDSGQDQWPRADNRRHFNFNFNFNQRELIRGGHMVFLMLCRGYR